LYQHSTLAQLQFSRLDVERINYRTTSSALDEGRPTDCVQLTTKHPCVQMFRRGEHPVQYYLPFPPRHLLKFAAATRGVKTSELCSNVAGSGSRRLPVSPTRVAPAVVEVAVENPSSPILSTLCRSARAVVTNVSGTMRAGRESIQPSRTEIPSRSPAIIPQVTTFPQHSRRIPANIGPLLKS
jgi:hypothetical protein